MTGGTFKLLGAGLDAGQTYFRTKFPAGRKSHYWRAVALGAVLAGSPVVAAQTQAQALKRQVPQSQTQVKLTFSPIVKKVLPAIVNVYAERTNVTRRNPLFDDPFFRQFFGAQPRKSRSLGSGVIVDSSGLVVTNHHVIAGMTKIRVALADHREFQAEVILRDKRTDLAVLRIKEGKNFPVVELGDSDNLEVGDIVLAVGNPFGVGQTVTQGIVSGLARTRTGISDYGFFIQTDAAINPGNSGGALIDINGRLTGINTAIYSRSGGSNGIGFAVPVNMVKFVINAARGGGKVRRPWVGATVQRLTKEIAESLGMDRPAGALVSKVYRGSSSARAGLKRGDVIVSIDGRKVVDPESFGYRLATKPIGGKTVIGVSRQGRLIKLPVRLTTAPENPPRETLLIGGRSPFSGATVVNYSPAIAEELSVRGEFTRAVVIEKLKAGSPAQQVGLQAGDVIVAINDVKIGRTRELRQATSQRKYFWKITISRKGRIFNSVFRG